jgi:hypothetical protein
MPKQRNPSIQRLLRTGEYVPEAIRWPSQALAIIVLSIVMRFVILESAVMHRRTSAQVEAYAKLIDINYGTLQELESLPGVGPVLARSILAARPFSSVGDLQRVRGIGPSAMERLRALIKAPQGRRAVDNDGP